MAASTWYNNKNNSNNNANNPIETNDISKNINKAK